LIDAAFRKQAWVVLGGVVAMGYMGGMAVQKIIDDSKRKT
jgi:hypothetical protein